MQDSRGRASIFPRNRHTPGVRNGACRDVLKVWVYAILVVLLGAWSSPFFYNAGKALSEVTMGKKTNSVLKQLGDICGRADFPVFYVGTMIGIALLLFLPFVESLDMKRAGKGLKSGQPLKKSRRRLLDCFTGFFLVSGLFLLIGYAMLSTGSFVWRETPASLTDIARIYLPALFLGVVIVEWIFRGVALGIFLRGAGSSSAITLSAILFTSVYLMRPPEGMNVPDPDAAGVGFELLKMVLQRFLDPWVWAKDVLPLFAMGWVLGYARWRTASIWMPLGLHAGWVTANALFLGYSRPVFRSDLIAQALAGRTLAEGLIPLAGILVVGTLIYFLTDSSREVSISDA